MSCNEVNSKLNLEKVEKKIKFYQTYLFKLVTSCVTIVTFAVSGFYYTNKYIVDKSVKDVTKSIRDSLQDEAIREKGENIGDCYKYVEKTNEKVNIIELDQNKTDKKVDNIVTTLVYYFNKVDKSINLLLQRNTEIHRVDSLNNEYQRKYAYNDSLSVDNMPRETIEVMYKSDKIREADYVEDLNGFNETLKACKPVNPLKYFIFIP